MTTYRLPDERVSDALITEWATRDAESLAAAGAAPPTECQLAALAAAHGLVSPFKVDHYLGQFWDAWDGARP